MMSDYTLYMDESETFNSAGNRYFVMSGVIIPTMGCQLIEQKLDQLKYVVWNGVPIVRSISYTRRMLALRVQRKTGGS